MKRNYSKELEEIIEKNKKEGLRPSLLLHCCCAPCSSYCLEYLNEHFKITLFYYNPNIHPQAEYEHRINEVKRLIKEMRLSGEVDFIEGENNPQLFYEHIKGMEKEREGSVRCFACYELRMKEAARIAKEGNFDYFTTTLSISPHKNAEKINETGEALSKIYGVPHLPSDFKKKNGYKRSIELSRKYGLYRQDYCGCIFSLRNS